MNQYQKFTKSILLLFAPLITSTALVTSPSQAATFASSEGVLNFTTFSQSPLNVGTFAGSNTSTIANDSMAIALANVQATFIVAQAEAFNSSLSQAFGKGSGSYLGLAESEAKVIGNFVVDADTPFSFDFTTALNLETSTDNPSFEKARATGDIFFVLFDSANNDILDFFNLVGDVNTDSDSDFIAFQTSDNITLNNPISTSNFGDNQEFARADIQGSLKRDFTKKTNLTLIEVNRNQARVQVPEPSSIVSLILCCGAISIMLKCRRKTTK